MSTTSTEFDVKREFKAFANEIETRSDGLAPRFAEAYTDWSTAENLAGNKHGVSDYVRHLLEVPLNQKEKPETSRAIQAAHYLLRKARQLAGEGPTTKGDKSESEPKAKATETSRSADGVPQTIPAAKPTLDDAVDVLLENLADDQRATVLDMLRALRWKKAPNWAGVRFGIIALPGADMNQKVAA